MAPELSPEAWAQIRHDYEHSERPIADICAEHRISDGTLRDRMRRWNWTRRRPPIPREGPPAVAMRLEHPTPTVFADAQTVDPPPPGEGNRDDGAPVPQPAFAASAESDPAQIAPRLQSAVARVLPAIEATLARLASVPQRPREMEQTARALGALMRTLRELNALLAQHPPPVDDPVPEDIDEFRWELARRIRGFIEAYRAERGEAEAPSDDAAPAA